MLRKKWIVDSKANQNASIHKVGKKNTGGVPASGVLADGCPGWWGRHTGTWSFF